MATFKEIKKRVELKLIGDKKIPEDQDLSFLIVEAVEFISSVGTPYKLISTDVVNDEVFRWITDTQFLKKIVAPTSESEEILIDDDLVSVVVAHMVATLTGDEEKRHLYTRERDRGINMHQWNAYNFMLDSGLEEDIEEDGVADGF